MTIFFIHSIILFIYIFYVLFLSLFYSRIRRFDTIALTHARRAPTDNKATSFAETDTNILSSMDTDTSVRTTTEPGLPIDYCIFCYHGTSKLLRHDNTALLSRFVSERGAILPKRFTKACTKHQRLLSKIIQRSRWLNLLPYHTKLHPRLRFTSMRPDISRESNTAGLVNIPTNNNNNLFSNLSNDTTDPQTKLRMVQQQQYLHDIATMNTNNKSTNTNPVTKS